MPQGRKKVPFSAKQKKLQLLQKREKKRGEVQSKRNSGEAEGKIIPHSSSSVTNKGGGNDGFEVEMLNKQPFSDPHRNPNRYRLFFKKETDDEIRKRKEIAMKPYEILSEEHMEVRYEDIFIPGSELDIPKRQPWDYSLTKEELEAKEHKYFKEYLENLQRRFGEEELSYFELNLETWRQLWRVLEMSDIILLIVDIRHPVFHFSPSLYDYITKDLQKDMILVLNKIDLVPGPLVLAWEKYFKQHFPKLHIMCFAAYAGMTSTAGKRGRRKGKLHMATDGSRRLLRLCEEIVNGEVDLSNWHTKIEKEATDMGIYNEADEDADDEDDDEEEEEDGDGDFKAHAKNRIQKVANDTSQYQEVSYKDGILTIGCVGHPNVGKSSLLNALMGRKVVSVSRSPGHTKHFQTIFLTSTVRLCDCPGLVFPSIVPKPLQVLMGCYPIAQLREPFSVVGFMAQRIPVHHILKLQHPEKDSETDTEVEWSAFDICEAWAKKRGFVTSRTARYDVFRAANNILRMALDGRTLCLCFYPPAYTKEKDFWASNPDVEKIRIIQGFRQAEDSDKKAAAEEESNSEDEVSDNSTGDNEDEEEFCDVEEFESNENETASSINKYALLSELT